MGYPLPIPEDDVKAAIPDRGYTIVLDERGETIDSLKFARWLERLTIDSPHGITFVIGGDVGMDESVRRRADKLLALSKMTLPHQFARVVLLEQIYREKFLCLTLLAF